MTGPEPSPHTAFRGPSDSSLCSDQPCASIVPTTGKLRTRTCHNGDGSMTANRSGQVRGLPGRGTAVRDVLTGLVLARK